VALVVAFGLPKAMGALSLQPVVPRITTWFKKTRSRLQLIIRLVRWVINVTNDKALTSSRHYWWRNYSAGPQVVRLWSTFGIVDTATPQSLLEAWAKT